MPAEASPPPPAPETSARSRVAGALLAAYKRWLSPLLHALLHTIAPLAGGCRFQPTCSEYAAEAIARHGWLRGGGLALWRLLRCNPLTPTRCCGWDPVPERTPSQSRQNHLR